MPNSAAKARRCASPAWPEQDRENNRIRSLAKPTPTRAVNVADKALTLWSVREPRQQHRHAHVLESAHCPRSEPCHLNLAQMARRKSRVPPRRWPPRLTPAPRQADSTASRPLRRLIDCARSTPPSASQRIIEGLPAPDALLGSGCCLRNCGESSPDGITTTREPRRAGVVRGCPTGHGTSLGGLIGVAARCPTAPARLNVGRGHPW